MTEQIRQKTGTGYFPGLQALRGIAILGVYFCHAGVLVRATWILSVFFVLSGFLTAYRHRSGPLPECSPAGCLRYAWRRIRRLYPLYFLTLLFFLALLLRSLRAGALPGTRLSDIALTFGLNVALLQAWAPYNSIYYSFNTPAWFLSAIVFMYFVTPPLLRVLRRSDKRGLIRALALVCGVYCAYSFALALAGSRIPAYAHEWFFCICPAYRLGDYLVGCCLGFLYPYAEARKIPKRRAAAAELAILALSLLTYVLYYRQLGFLSRIGLGSTVLLLPAASLLVLFMALDRGGVLSLLNNPVTRFFGRISGTAFLIHFPILTVLKRVLNHYGMPDEGNPLYIWGGLALTILLSPAWDAFRARIRTGRAKQA